MRNVLISGGSRGIGAALVRAFCRRGDRVAFLYRQSHDAAKALAAETGAFAIVCDVSSATEVEAGVAAAAEALGGPIEIFVGNAGISGIALVGDVSPEEWRRMIDTNLSANFYLVRALQGGMIRNGWGRIVLIGSMWGKVGSSMEVPYSASKAGLRGLTMSLAKELGPSAVTVNCVEPGVINTEMNAEIDEDILDGLAEATPLCRIGQPEEVAAAVLFFASDEASFVTGQCLGVDGGFAI